MTGAATSSFPIFSAAANENPDPLVVSVHDVAPPTQRKSAKIIEELGKRGLRVCSLLVVPDYHHTGASTADRAFVQWLRDLESAGHEIVIHGYFHERPRRPGESWRAKAITRSYTSDEGEFYDLDYNEALERINRAKAEFTGAGLKPRGFIAPAWLLSAEAERAAADAEMEYTTRLTSVCDLRTGQIVSSRSLVYSVRNSWRRTASLVWNETLARVLSTSPLLRIGVHPVDLDHFVIWKQITRLVSQFAEARRATTYRDWIAEQRAQQSR